MPRNKSKHKQRQKRVDEWTANVEKELKLTAQQYGLEVASDSQGEGDPLVTLTSGEKKRKRQKRSKGVSSLEIHEGVERSNGDFSKLKELFGGEFKLGKCCFPACRCGSKASKGLKKVKRRKGVLNEGEWEDWERGYPGDQVAAKATCEYCGHPTIQHKARLGQWKLVEDSQRMFCLMRLARVAVSNFSSPTWCLQALVALEGICNTANATPTEIFYSKEVRPILAMASEFVVSGFDAEAKVAVVSILDELYFRLYHHQQTIHDSLSEETSVMSAMVRNGAVPAPDTYFKSLATYTYKPDDSTQQFLRQKVSEKKCKEMCELWETERPSNPLLQIFNSRFSEGIRLFYIERLGMNGEMDMAVRSSRPKKWRKKSLFQPPCYPLLQKWRNACRDWCCHLYSYAVPTEAALSALASYNPLVELGAGLGFWASLLKTRGVDIVAYDAFPTTETKNDYHGQLPPFTEVLKGDFEVLKDMQNRSLFLCYPPPMHPMAWRCLKNFQGTHFIHVGEWEGDTGDRRFESALQSEFELVDRIPLPNWGNTVYEMTIWKRKEEAKAQAEVARMLKCSWCGSCEEMSLRTCSLCRIKTYCSQICAAKDADSHCEEHSLRLIFLEGDLDFAESRNYYICYRGHAQQEMAQRKENRDAIL